MKKRLNKKEVKKALKGFFSQPLVPSKKDLTKMKKDNESRIKESWGDWEKFRKILDSSTPIDLSSFEGFKGSKVLEPSKVVAVSEKTNSELLLKQLVRNIIEQIKEETMIQSPKPTAEDKMFDSIIEAIPSIMIKNISNRDKAIKIQGLIESNRFAFDRIHRTNASSTVEKSEAMLEKIAQEREKVREFAIKNNLTTILPQFYHNEENGESINQNALMEVLKGEKTNGRKPKSVSSNSRKSRKSGAKR